VSDKPDCHMPPTSSQLKGCCHPTHLNVTPLRVKLCKATSQATPAVESRTRRSIHTPTSAARSTAAPTRPAPHPVPPCSPPSEGMLSSAPPERDTVESSIAKQLPQLRVMDVDRGRFKHARVCEANLQHITPCRTHTLMNGVSRTQLATLATIPLTKSWLQMLQAWLPIRAAAQ
jgi:hypothetical protein